MVPEKLITADCHITPPLSIVNELPERMREYFPRLEKDETGKDVYKMGHIVSLSMMTGEGSDSDIQADATGAEGNIVSEAHLSLDAAEQLADLERDGVYGAVLIGRIADMPNGIPADATSPITGWPATGWPITGPVPRSRRARYPPAVQGCCGVGRRLERCGHGPAPRLLRMAS
jgi:hypothetical protein